MFTRQFWIDTAERAIKTAAQAAVLVFGAGQVDAFAVDWQLVASMSVGAACLSIATSLASSLSGDPDTPSLVD